MLFEIYKIKNKINNKCYIGQTTIGALNRFKQHCKADTIIGKAIRKYGMNNFEINVEKVCFTKNDANICEEKYIKLNQCVVPNGYNANQYGRLIGDEYKDYFVDFIPEIKRDIFKIYTSVELCYLQKILLLSNTHFILMKTSRTPIKTWKEIWVLIGCSSKEMIARLKRIIEKYNITEKVNNSFKINSKICKIYY